MRCWGVVLHEFQHCFGFYLYRNFLCPPPHVLAENPSGRWYSAHVETSHERDLTATRYDPFEIRGFGPIFLSLSCYTAKPHHPESRIFPAECIIYLLSYMVALICLHFPQAYLQVVCEKKNQEYTSRDKFTEKLFIRYLYYYLFYYTFRQEFKHRWKRVTKRILFSDPIQT